MTWLAATVPGAVLAVVWTVAVLRLATQADDHAAARREQAATDKQFWQIITHLLLTTEETDQP